MTVVYMKTNIKFLPYLAHFLLKWKIFLTNVVEKIETNILCSKPFFENRTIYEIMWKISAERGRLQRTIWRMRISCWMTKAKIIHSEYVVLTDFQLQQWLHESASVLPFKFIPCPVYDSHIQHVNILCWHNVKCLY